MEEEAIEEKSHSSSESADELEFDDRVGRDELFELLKRKEEDADDESEEEVEITDDEVDEGQENEDVVEAENTWDAHLNAELTAKQIASISDKKSYETSKISLSVYKHTIIKKPQNVDLPELRSFEDPSELHIRDRIRRNMRKMDEREKNLFSLFHQYKDVYCPASSRRVLSPYVTHVLNHVMKSDRLVRSNTLKLTTMTDEEKGLTDIRDKQLMKPKVLIIAPFRSNAKKIVDEMIRLLTPPSGKLEVAFRKRFNKEFGHDPVAEKEFQKKNRPDEYKRIFAGNSDDHFRMGLSYTPKQLKLYTPFYTSDVIIASPLGLKRVIGDDSEDKKKEHDFLSSIEIVVVEHADYILMQNFAHLLYIFKNLNLMPKKAHDCDFGRVKLWSAEGHSKYYRQTILLSHTPNLNFSSIMSKLCFNYRGSAECQLPEVASSLALKNVALPIPQIFRKVAGANMREVLENRYKIFMKIMNEISRAKIKNVLVYIPDSLHFYVLREKLAESKIEHVCLTEETTTGRSKTAKIMFESGERPILIFTERRHFFHRVTQRKVSRVIFFAPPSFPHYYAEVSNFIIDPSFSDVTVLCSRFDLLQLESILGKSEAKSLMRNKKDIVCFMNEK